MMLIVCPFVYFPDFSLTSLRKEWSENQKYCSDFQGVTAFQRRFLKHYTLW
ncbi:MAG: hypothetical protein IKS49_00140 [Actinomycetaceae bacterium]|nr:hypothetical protein [Actinomycetaceae bacterium]